MLFHYAPAVGWMNDPNGLIYWNGRHHLFYQHNPSGIDFATIGWGHASSADLLNWHEHAEVLIPGAGGTDYDADGCFSGCAVPDEDGGVLLVYTGVAGDMQLPCLAHSADHGLERFEKDPANPVIKARPSDDVLAFRDHAVRRVNGGWHHAIGGQTAQLGGAVFGYMSTDLHDWQFDRVVLDATRCDIPDSIWECPDLFDTPNGTVLIVSIVDFHRPAKESLPLVWYATGQWRDGELMPGATERLDYGDRFYAPQSYWIPDGRRIQFGWIRTDLDPTVTGDSRGVMSIPREVRVRADGTLETRAARELQALRGTSQAYRLSSTDAVTTCEFAQSRGAIELAMTSGAGVSDVRLVRRRDGAMVDVDVTAIPGDRSGPMQLYFDGGLVELFVDDRAATCTGMAVPEIDAVEIRHGADAAGKVVTVWPLAPTRVIGS
jgi:beta-fructofuranosidase